METLYFVTQLAVIIFFICLSVCIILGIQMIVTYGYGWTRARRRGRRMLYFTAAAAVVAAILSATSIMLTEFMK